MMNLFLHQSLGLVTDRGLDTRAMQAGSNLTMVDFVNAMQSISWYLLIISVILGGLVWIFFRKTGGAMLLGGIMSFVLIQYHEADLVLLR